MIRTTIATALLALTGAAHAANWSADCVGSHNGEHYKIAWHLVGSVTSFYIMPANKPAFTVPLVMENGWGDYKLVASAEIQGGRVMELNLENNALWQVSPKGSYIEVLSPSGDVLTQDVCVVTRIWE
jgi:hypothetical protein